MGNIKDVKSAGLVSDWIWWEMVLSVRVVEVPVTPSGPSVFSSWFAYL